MSLEKLIEDCSSMDYVTPALLSCLTGGQWQPPACGNQLRVDGGVTEPTDVLWWLKHM